MIAKLNISKILKDHFGSQFSNFGDCLVFLIFPVIIASCLSYSKVFISYNILQIVIAVLSIFVGLLLNVIVLLFDIMNKESTRLLKINLLQEVLANVSFTILLSIATILVILPTMLPKNYGLALQIFNGITYYFLILFLLNIIMILKRVYALFFDESELSKKGKE